MTDRNNGSIKGVGNTPTTSLASGIWDLNNVMLARRQGIWPMMIFPGGNQSYGSLKEMLENMAAYASANVTAGGTLTINGQSLGSYDYVIKVGNQTIASGWTLSDWFTTTQDSRSAIIVVVGDLTINASQIFTPSVRKLFMALYVTGTLTITGEISMSKRGANHHTSGSNITAAAIRLATGTYSGVTDPQVPSAGASGGTGVVATAGNVGSTGTAGQTGGGGSGADRNSVGSSAGSSGTSFSGGPGSGAGRWPSGTSAGEPNGGAGGTTSTTAGNQAVGGGAGNPGGTGGSGGGGAVGHNGENGTGGVLYIQCGTLAGAGAISASGANGGGTSGTLSADSGGAGSGGGSVTVLYGSDTSSISPTATGGVGATPTFNGAAYKGGNGGNGTARKLAA